MLDSITCPCCGRKAENRGVCHGTYTAARRMVLAGKTTWEELIARGVVLESRQGWQKDSQHRKRYLMGKGQDDGEKNQNGNSNHVAPAKRLDGHADRDRHRIPQRGGKGTKRAGSQGLDDRVRGEAVRGDRASAEEGAEAPGGYSQRDAASSRGVKR